MAKLSDETAKLTHAARQSHFTLSSQVKPIFYNETSTHSAFTKDQFEKREIKSSTDINNLRSANFKVGS
jgi:hypothetical protein